MKVCVVEIDKNNDDKWRAYRPPTKRSYKYAVFHKQTRSSFWLSITVVL
jgi:hypothetical protein